MRTKIVRDMTTGRWSARAPLGTWYDGEALRYAGRILPAPGVELVERDITPEIAALPEMFGELEPEPEPEPEKTAKRRASK